MSRALYRITFTPTHRPKLVTPAHAALPPRCVKCGAPADGHYVQRVFWWHRPAFLLLLFAGGLIYSPRMSTTTPLLTADDLWRLPPDGRRRELVRGGLRTMPPAGADHGDVTNNFAFLLTGHVKPRALGKAFAAETGFRLARDPDTVVGADVAFVPADRIPPTGLPKGFWDGAPDLAAETVSPGDTVEEVGEKVDAYLAAGARAVLVLNPRRKSVTSHRRGQNPIVRHAGDVLRLDDVVPGFSCDVSAIFG